MAHRSSHALTSPDRPVRQCRDILVRQLGGAVEELGGSKPNIHGARKQLKRARATLRLLRPAIEDQSYRRENVAARDGARPLSTARDEEVMNEALDGLLERFGAAASGVNTPQLRQSLHKGPRAKGSGLSAGQLNKIKTALKRSAQRVRAWKLETEGWACIASGLRVTYRRARHALRRARTQRATDDLHEWRKQTKYLWHQLQILTPLAPGPVGELADEFHHLADYLGDEHDLAVLRGRLSGPVTDLIERRREELQDKAFALGARLYTEKSKAFVHELQQHWNAWERRRSARHQTAISAP
jgi:CHAD domain-containing protein